MAVLHHFIHECELTSSEIVVDGICNLCFKDKPISFACNSCNFDLCEDCSKLPQKVSHDFHPEHHFEFCLVDHERKPRHVICSGCGHMCSRSFYECKECEIYLDPECAIEANIFRGWDVKEKLHDSHCHLLRRCKPGQTAIGSCLLCELPFSIYAICYGCVHCYWFVHERCLNLPREIQHRVHPAHPLKRLDYIRASGARCKACKNPFISPSFGCIGCGFDLHMRCADSLLRGLMHKSHHHMLFYVPRNARIAFGAENPCQICKGAYIISLDSYYHCVECGLNFHFECLAIPEFIVKKRYHIHPLVCKVLMAEEEDSLEYCGVCETMVRRGHHIYSCEECDFLAHLDCILREEVPSPLYLKDLFSFNKNIKRLTHPEDGETSEVENKILINDIAHIHVMRLVNMSELDQNKSDHVCNICDGVIFEHPFKCETCDFQSHNFCAKMGKSLTYKGLHREHPNHPLTLLPLRPPGGTTKCYTCGSAVQSFNLFCRICNIIIHARCVLKDMHFVGALQRGQKVMGIAEEKCRRDLHRLFNVLVSRSYTIACTVCDERLISGTATTSCMECGEIYHKECGGFKEVVVSGHRLHPSHDLEISLLSGSTCLVCKLSISRYGYRCKDGCKVSYHTKCLNPNVRQIVMCGPLGELIRKNNSKSEKYLEQYYFAPNKREVIQHFFHECALTSPETIDDGICNFCFKDKPISFACDVCNFDLCKDCSKLPRKVSHGFHPEHSLEFFLVDHERKPRYVICSGCGNMCSGSFYECKECEIYLDQECATGAKNILRGWDVKEKLHDSHCHLLKRCRPGPDATGSCLLCELPLSPSAICYGCVHCYSFVHERCFDIPREIQHPVHPAHPLVRQDYVRASGARCDACKSTFKSPPFGCIECGFDLHLRCADSLLRGLMHKSHHHHRLFYVPTNADEIFGKCQICKGAFWVNDGSCYHCVECGLMFHFECLEIPESVFKKRYHVHPLVLRRYLPKEDCSSEYCGVCETMVFEDHHIYSCKECDFLGHIDCILQEEVPSPLYLKDLFPRDEKIKRLTHSSEDCETNEVENKIILVNDAKTHIHVMRLVDMSVLVTVDNYRICRICEGIILEYPFKCEFCDFQAHSFCAKLGKPSTHKGLHQEHPNHPLTLLPRPPPGSSVYCGICKGKISDFNLLCRICDIIIHIKCVVKNKRFVGAFQRGIKVMGGLEGRCMHRWHPLSCVLLSRSHQTVCSFCDEGLSEIAASCVECGEIYHMQCAELWKRNRSVHPLHPFHDLDTKLVSGSICVACKLNITKYGHCCSAGCKVSFHIKCIQVVVGYPKRCSWGRHYLYNFWIDDTSRVTTRACSVCGTPCGASFYGCISCSFYAHVECFGFSTNVRNQLHQHSLYEGDFQGTNINIDCSLCGSRCDSRLNYVCYHCEDVFHRECIISMDDREPATEDEQLKEIYLMCLERNLFEMMYLQ